MAIKCSASAVKTGLLDKWCALLPLNFLTCIRSYYRIFWSSVYGLSAFPDFILYWLKYALENKLFLWYGCFHMWCCCGPLIPSHQFSEEGHALLLLLILSTEQLVETLAICSFKQIVLWLFQPLSWNCLITTSIEAFCVASFPLFLSSGWSHSFQVDELPCFMSQYLLGKEAS